MGRLKTFDDIVGLKELRQISLYRALAAEYFGTLILVFNSCGPAFSVVPIIPNSIIPPLVTGLTLTVVIIAFCHISGGHVNPAVTFGCMVARFTPLVRGILYIAAQCFGAVVAYALLYSMVETPCTDRHKPGLVLKSNGMSEGQAFGMEVILTFILLLVVMAVVDERRTDNSSSPAIFIGLTVVANIAVGMKLSGGCMNPARALAPAAVLSMTTDCSDGVWTAHWVYWVGPLIGGALGSLLYTYAFRQKKIKL